MRKLHPKKEIVLRLQYFDDQYQKTNLCSKCELPSLLPLLK